MALVTFPFAYSSSKIPESVFYFLLIKFTLICDFLNRGVLDVAAVALREIEHRRIGPSYPRPRACGTGHLTVL